MNSSLRNKIQLAFIGSILTLGLCAGMVIFVNQLSAVQNQKIVETMTKEYKIISLTDELILAYNDAVKSLGDVPTMTKYQAKHDELLGLLTSLKLQISSEESQQTFVGVENTVKKVIAECDAGLHEVKEGDLLNISGHFVEANSNNVFVKDNTRNLLQKELEYFSKIQESTKKTYLYSLYISIGLYMLIVTILVIFASSFSRQLILPIEKLSRAAEKVAAGEMETPIDKKLLDQKDEVGILSKSFLYMVETVKSKISELSTSNKELATSKEALENGNAELEKLNSFMVDRELKMVELKKEIAELKGSK